MADEQAIRAALAAIQNAEDFEELQAATAAWATLVTNAVWPE